MKVIVADNYEQLSAMAAEVIEDQVNMKSGSVIGLATGGTPLGTYKHLIKGFRERSVDYSQVSTFNLDEYVGLDENHPKSYHQFMQQNLFNHLNINQSRTYIPNGNAESLDEECLLYEQLIEEIGPPDLQLLGIGENGHIGFNEPGSSFQGITHIEQLDESTREANARFFNSVEEVPLEAITMGIGSILKSNAILLLASGEHKSKAISRLLEGEADEQFPASALLEHPNVTLVVDRAAYQLAEADEGERNHAQ